jgi:ribosomal protein S18 acetylase RimI-like enzyme
MRWRSLRPDEPGQAPGGRPEWTWLAEEGGRVVARAAWWGRADGDRPLVLDDLWADPSAGDPAGVAGPLLVAAHAYFRQRYGDVPAVFRLVLPNDWRADPAARAALAWRREAVAAVGLTHEVERLQFLWTPDAGVAAPDGRLVFAAEPDDAAMLDLFRRVGDDSLDDETRKNRTRAGAEWTARDELDFYLRAPGERGWWRVARTPGGATAGLAVPSATADNPNVGYLGVVPELRGRGLVRSLLDEVTRSHAGRGARRVTATTDVSNFPMVAAFRAAGYRNTQTRIMFSAP